MYVCIAVILCDAVAAGFVATRPEAEQKRIAETIERAERFIEIRTKKSKDYQFQHLLIKASQARSQGINSADLVDQYWNVKSLAAKSNYTCYEGTFHHHFMRASERPIDRSEDLRDRLFVG